jgi:lipopolysaccharide heptosyltransferase II
MKEADYNKILIFNVNWLGDVLFSTAAIRNIRRNFPRAFIACAIPSRCYPVLKGNPHLDEVIIFDEKDRHKGILKRFAFVLSLKKREFDAVFLLHRSFSRALICRLAGIPQRIGHYTRKRGFLLTKKIIPPQRDSLHRIDYYLDIIRQAGLKVEDRHTEFFVGDDDMESAGNFLKKNGVDEGALVVVINPGGNWLSKRWPKEYWAELADRLIDELKARVVISGGHNDLSLAEQIRERMKYKPVIACGCLNIKQLGALAKLAGIFITADTGPMHIANSVGARKIVAIFGPTSPQITGPCPVREAVILQKDVGCAIPCYNLRCRDARCMKVITPDDVIRSLKAAK